MARIPITPSGRSSIRSITRRIYARRGRRRAVIPRRSAMPVPRLGHPPAGNARPMASYALNDAAVANATRLIDARQYVLDSDWGDVQPNADAQNDYLGNHDWDDYAAWHLGLTEGANDGTKARYAFVYGDFRRIHRTRAHRLRVPGVGVASQGGRAGSPRPPPAPRRLGGHHGRLTVDTHQSTATATTARVGTVVGWRSRHVPASRRACREASSQPDQIATPAPIVAT